MHGTTRIKDFSASKYRSEQHLSKHKEAIPVRSLLKRGFDIIISSILMIVLGLVLFPFIALIIAFNSRGGVFFTQLRTGLDMKPFKCYKLRTMRPVQKGVFVSEEQRITSVGTFLRAWHIDELPQLWNVLKGDMSLVGPRPHMLSDTERFEVMVPNYNYRHTVRPGITGLAQVTGYYGWVENEEHLKQRVWYDINYIKNWRFRHDLAILFRTLLIPFMR